MKAAQGGLGLQRTRSATGDGVDLAVYPATTEVEEITAGRSDVKESADKMKETIESADTTNIKRVALKDAADRGRLGD